MNERSDSRTKETIYDESHRRLCQRIKTSIQDSNDKSHARASRDEVYIRGCDSPSRAYRIYREYNAICSVNRRRRFTESTDVSLKSTEF